MAAEQFMVIEFELPTAEPAHYGPGSLEECEAYAERRRSEKRLPKGVERRDVVIVPLEPLPSAK